MLLSVVGFCPHRWISHVACMVGDTGTGFEVARPQHNLAQLEDEVVILQDEESMVNPTWMATMPKLNSPPDILCLRYPYY
jgi:hypothetical protein